MSSAGDESPPRSPGPLDQLWAGLREKTEPLPPQVVHPKATWASLSDGTRALVCASFRAPKTATELHKALKPLLEAALLSELSRPASQVAAEYLEPSRVFFYVFSPLGFEPEPALTPLGLQKAAVDAPLAASALALARREAQLVQGSFEEPVACFMATVQRGSHPLGEKLRRELTHYPGNGAWGTAPGLWARAAADALERLGMPDITPTPSGVNELQNVCAHETPDVIRWIDPLCFQALCDLIGVYAAERLPEAVEWGQCEADDHGVAPPPLLRVTREGESFHVPVGAHVLQWCVMPCRAGEQIPSLGEWMEHEFS